MAALRDQLSQQIKDLENALQSKLDFGALEDIEKQLMDRMNEIILSIQDKFADRKDTKKSIKTLERQIKNLFDLLQSKGTTGDNGDEAMFNRKHICGYACASCEKNLVNLYGKKIEYMPWGKMPFRDPSERIARVGQGFSKMLSIISPEQMSRYEGER